MHSNTATANLSSDRQRVPAAFDAGLAELVNGLAALLSGLGLFLVVFTLIPFQGAVVTDPNAANEGNIINQVGYLVLGAIYLFAMLLTV
ncbi:hypothetical protein, partial [Ensifer sp. SSB1]|uniref:hypothetical protein n=1 Tax=Ensifer sp. SSB1 TaxID=2795385 RepID=UPI001A3EA5CD